MTDRRLRLGASWARRAGDNPHALVTLVDHDPAEGADAQGRRWSDRCVGQVLSAARARAVCESVNRLRSEGQPPPTVDDLCGQRADGDVLVTLIDYNARISIGQVLGTELAREICVSMNLTWAHVP